jgi:hypothetical protein
LCTDNLPVCAACAQQTDVMRPVCFRPALPVHAGPMQLLQVVTHCGGVWAPAYSVYQQHMLVLCHAHMTCHIRLLCGGGNAESSTLTVCVHAAHGTVFHGMQLVSQLSCRLLAQGGVSARAKCMQAFTPCTSLCAKGHQGLVSHFLLFISSCSCRAGWCATEVAVVPTTSQLQQLLAVARCCLAASAEQHSRLLPECSHLAGYNPHV